MMNDVIGAKSIFNAAVGIILTRIDSSEQPILMESLSRPDHLMDVLSAYLKVRELLVENAELHRRLHQAKSTTQKNDSDNNSTRMDIAENQSKSPVKRSFSQIETETGLKGSESDDEDGPRRKKAKVEKEITILNGGKKGITYPQQREMTFLSLSALSSNVSEWLLQLREIDLKARLNESNTKVEKEEELYSALLIRIESTIEHFHDAVVSYLHENNGIERFNRIQNNANDTTLSFPIATAADIPGCVCKYLYCGYNTNSESEFNEYSNDLKIDLAPAHAFSTSSRLSELWYQFIRGTFGVARACQDLSCGLKISHGLLCSFISYLASWSNHLKNLHPDVENTNVRCTHCGKEFDAIFKLFQHEANAHKFTFIAPLSDELRVHDDFATMNTASQSLAKFLYSPINKEDLTEYEQDVIANLIVCLRRGEFRNLNTLMASTRIYLVALISAHIAAQELTIDQSDPITVDILDEVLAPLRGLVSELPRIVSKFP